MIISTISDVHIFESSDKNFKLLERFFEHSRAISSNYIVLNGDIFDILIGGKAQYLKKYRDFFKLVKSVTDTGIIIIYIEGNHDFHIENLIKKSISEFKINGDSFLHVKEYFDISVDGKLIRFTHGDDVEVENEKYRNYKKNINNKFMKFLGDYIVPFHIIEWLGHNASSKSRHNNLHQYELSEEGQAFVKDKFRRSAKLYFRDHPEVYGLVCGHSHCKDHLTMENGKFYINNGYAPSEKSFIKITNEGAGFVAL